MNNPVHSSPSADQLGGPYRVMVCDDSAVVRGLITRGLEQDADIQIVTSVSNGQQAIDALNRHPIEICILDVEMPIMDGLTALPTLIQSRPDLQIIVASTLTLRNAEISLNALQKGAADYVTKPSNLTAGLAAEDFRIGLVAKVKALGASRRRIAGMQRPGVPALDSQLSAFIPKDSPTRSSTSDSAGRSTGYLSAESAKSTPQPIKLREASPVRPEIIAIGASTGGPQALFTLLQELRGSVTQPIILTQHMPPTFTTILAEHITRLSGCSAFEAVDGMPIKKGYVYVAPGDFHLTVQSEGGQLTARLLKTPPENFCRPSVDPMLRSLVEAFGRRVLAVILTGMGQDGLKGSEAVVAGGGSVVAQDEATSIVWGMPRAVAKAGLCSAVLPLSQMASEIKRLAMRGAS